jgi:hypothetical protein
MRRSKAFPDSLIVAIYSMRKSGVGYDDISKACGVSHGTVRNACTGKTHRHLNLKPLPNLSERERILSKSSLDLHSGCWNWTSYRNKNGYGQTFFNGKYIGAHRASYLAFIGDISNGMHVCHKCDNRACVNPDHLFLGTNQDNINDKVAKGRQSRNSMPGSSHPMAKLNEDQVELILKMVNSGTPCIEVAKLFHVTDSTIRLIKKGETWKHVVKINQ